MSRTSTIRLAGVCIVVVAFGMAWGLRAASGGATIASSRPVIYVALGASDSVGVGALSPEREGWVPVLAGKLPPTSTLINLGISGALLRQAVDQQLPVALASRPDVITVWLGVNDLNARVPLERYRAELDQLLSQLRTGTDAAIFVGNLPDVTSLRAYERADRAALRDQVQRWNRTIADVCATRQVVLVDLFARWTGLAEHPEYIASDGFHPSSTGHRRLAEEFFQAISSAPGVL